MTIPVVVRDLALRLGATPARVSGPVTLTQSGKMLLRLNSNGWLPFTARQTMQITTCAFSWHARFWPFGYLSVTDALQAGHGHLDVTALGLIPLVRSKPTAALTKGEMLRYLAELPYAPDAMLHNPDLNWHQVTDNQLAVSTGAGDQRAEVVFNLNPDGRIGSVRAEDRPRSVKPPTLPTPWEGNFADYRLHNGRWVPFSAEVAWVIDGHRSLYWHGALTDWSIAPPVPGTNHFAAPNGTLPLSGSAKPLRDSTLAAETASAEAPH